MTTNVKHVLVLLCFAATTAGAAASVAEQRSVEDILAGRDQEIAERLFEISAPRIHGWQTVDLRNVVLEYGGSNLYLVGLDEPCPIMKSATGITMGHLGKPIHKGDAITIWGEGGPVVNPIFVAPVAAPAGAARKQPAERLTSA